MRIDGRTFPVACGNSGRGAACGGRLAERGDHVSSADVDERGIRASPSILRLDGAMRMQAR